MGLFWINTERLDYIVINSLISVVIPCYNAEKWIGYSIESILKQTYSNIEVIVINDGSTDNSRNIVNKYKSIDKRIVFISKYNTGLADTLNYGIKYAKGNIIARQDADDISDENRLEKQVLYMMKSNSIVVGTNCKIIDSDNRALGLYKYNSKYIARDMVEGKSPFPHSSVMYYKYIASNIGCYRKQLNGAEDVDLWLRMSRYGLIKCLQDELVSIRKHATSITNSAYGLYSIACAARVSHILRINNHEDPIDNSNCNKYIKWINYSVNKLNIMMGRMLHVDICNSGVLCKFNIITYIMYLKRMCMEQSILENINSYARYRRLNKYIAYYLANKWMNYERIGHESM